MAGKPVQRQGDFNSKGGIALGGVNSVKVNGRNIAVAGMTVTPHPPCPKRFLHCVAKTTVIGASSTVRAEGKRVILTGGTDSCTDSRKGGSPNVKAV